MANVDLNDQFINDTGSKINQADVKFSVSRDADGSITISETVPIINTLTSNSTITIDDDTTYGATNVTAGTYSIQYYDMGGGSNYANLRPLVDSDSDGYFSYASSGSISLSGSDLDLFVSDVNDGSLTIGTAQFVFDAFGVNWNTVTLTNSDVYYDASNEIPDGEYLVNKNGPDDVTLTLISSDTDYDQIKELDEDTVYQLYVNRQENWDDIENMAYNINQESQNHVVTSQSVLNVDYERSDTVVYLIDELGNTWNSVDLDVVIHILLMMVLCLMVTTK